MNYNNYFYSNEGINNGSPHDSQKQKVIDSIIVNISTIVSADQLRLIEGIIIKALHGVEFADTTTQPSADVDLTEYYLKLFTANAKLSGKKEDTIKCYLYSVRALLNAIDRPIVDITKDMIKYYLLTQQSTRHWSPSYVVTTVRYLNQVFKFLHDEGYIQCNPMRGITIKEPPKNKIVYLTEDEIVRMQDAAITLEEKAVLNFCLSTGCRVGEIVKIKRSDIDFQNRTVSIISEKSGNPRTVYLTPRAKKSLMDYLNSRTDSCESLFVCERRKRTRDGELGVVPIADFRLETISKELGMRANIDKKCTIHIFRRTLATTLINNNCPVQVIQAILGHSSSDVTLSHYASLANKNIQQNFDSYIQY